MRYEDIAADLTDFPFSFITFVLNVVKKLIKNGLPEFFCLFQCPLCNSQFIFSQKINQISQICYQSMHIVIQVCKFLCVDIE